MATMIITDRSPRTGGILAASLLLLLAAPALVQAQSDGRWTPWIGCWESADATTTAEGMLCIRPVADGVELMNVTDGLPVSAGIIIADGMPREASEEGCVGEERAEFSGSGDRVYLHAEHTCAGGVVRVSEGMFSMSTPSEWVQVETVTIEGRESSFVQTFRLASPARIAAAGLEELADTRGMAVQTSRIAASAPLTVDDVIEAAERLDAESLEAWIAVRGEPFDLSADDLQRMSDAGVPPSVIDVVVGVSYPQHFDIDRAYSERLGYGTGPVRGGFYDPFLRSRYDAFGYGYYGSRYGFGYYDYDRPTLIVVAPRDDDGFGSRVTPQGYSRGSSGSASAGRGSSGGSAVGASSGSTRRTTGRTAKPKPGGGGGG